VFYKCRNYDTISKCKNIHSISECKNIHKIYCILFRKAPRPSTSGLLQIASPSRSSKFPQILLETALKWYFKKLISDSFKDRIGLTKSMSYLLSSSTKYGVPVFDCLAHEPILLRYLRASQNNDSLTWMMAMDKN